jgi:hypothetical protein
VLVLAAFGGTAYAALSYMDTTQSADALRAERAAKDAVLAHRDQRAKRAARPGRKRSRASSAPAQRRWASRADALCDRAYDDIWAFASAREVKKPDDLMPLLERGVQMGDRLVAGLKRLGPAPNRKAYGRFVRALEASQAADKQALRAMNGRWDAVAFQRLMSTSRTANERLRRMALGLGSVGCSELYDPATF